MSIDTHTSLGDRIVGITELWNAANPGAFDDIRLERRRANFTGAWAGVREYRMCVDYALEHREQVSAMFFRSVDEHRRLLFEGADVGKTLADLYDERIELISRVHYEIKCVHVFGKIVLDRLAVAIRETFGTHNAPKLQRHAQIWKEKEGAGLVPTRAPEVCCRPPMI